MFITRRKFCTSMLLVGLSSCSSKNVPELFSIKYADDKANITQKLDALEKKTKVFKQIDKLNEKVIIAYQKANYSQGIELAKQALEMAHNELGDENHDTLACMNNLAMLYQAKGDYQQAEFLLTKSLLLKEKKPITKENLLDIATGKNNLAEIYRLQGKLRQAEELMKKGLEIKEKILDAGNPKISTSLNNLAALYKEQGKYELAEPLYQKSLRIDKNIANNEQEVATDLNNLATLYEAQGRYDDAEYFFKDSLNIKQKIHPQNHPDIAISLNNLAAIYKAQGRFNDAESKFVESLKIEKNNKNYRGISISLNNLAGLYEKQKKYNDAEIFYQKSIEIDEKYLGKDNLGLAITKSNLAGLYDTQGKYQLAEYFYNQSLAILEKKFDKNHPDIATNLNNLAATYFSQKKYQQAEINYKRGLVIREKIFGQFHPDIVSSLDNLILLYAIQGQYKKATLLLKKNLRIGNRLLERWLWGAGNKTRKNYLISQESVRNYYLNFYNSQNLPEEAFYFSLSRKGLLLNIATRSNVLIKNSLHNSMIEQLTLELHDIRNQLSNLTLSEVKKESIQLLEERQNDIEMQLLRLLPNFKRALIEVSPEQIIIKLTDKQVLIDFLVYDELDLKTLKYKNQQLIALVVDKKGIKLVKLGAMQPITQAIQAYHQVIEPKGETVRERMDSLKDANRKQILTANAKALYRKIWQPLLGYLGDKKEIYVIPDGALNVFPMKAMQDESGHYLAENYTLKLLSSARDIVLPPGNNGSSQASAIFAGVYYDEKQVAEAKTIEQAEQIELDKQQAEAAQAKGETVAKKRGDLKFPYLIKSFGEGLAIQAQMKTTQQPVNFFSGFAASEAAIKQVKSPRFLVLSTHGFFLEDQPAPRLEQAELLSVRGLLDNPFNVSAKLQDNPLTRSGLAFARANDGVRTTDSNNDGVLTALEVLGLDLENTDLVTLSACQTALGNIQVGEGVYSLNRAFQEAGAKAVLSTLWKVDDEKTQAFMQRFYAEVILNHVPVQQALQQTQINFITDAERPKIHQDPYFWAAFSMVGL